MDDPFASIISECIIPPAVEETLRHAPVIGEPSSSSQIRSLDGQTFSPAPNPSASSEIRRLAKSPLNPLDKESLTDIASRKEPSSLPPPRLRREDLINLIKYFAENSDRSLGRVDILEIAERKGLSFPPPEWWRPGGYKKVHSKVDWPRKGQFDYSIEESKL
ncbi:uncharacterized protein LOC110020661 [Phalaenopsis equestris]|uniref:uncharacterized protein LOC110020661 n=1 Tax=Phalaenopsis equestris TaxID=78828 RepID=UPI0009E42ACB|nr:uncharacterized protein LOC110020661 [Phalaenopsis equestris]